MIEQIKLGSGTIEALGQFEQSLKDRLLKKAAEVHFGAKQVGDKHYFGPEEERPVPNPEPGGVSGVARLPARMVLQNDPNLKFSDLAGEGLPNKEALEQSDELIREKAKEFVFKTLITHGKFRTSAETGKKELKDKADLDGQVCLALLAEAGIDISDVKYIPQDDESKLPEAGFAFDVTREQGWVLKNNGKLTIVSDKDRTSGKDSTAKFIHEGLVEFGLLPKDSKILERIVEFATKEDNMNYKDREVKDIFDNYDCNLMGLRNYLDVEQLLKVFKDQMKINSEFNPYGKIDPEYLKTLSYTDPKTGEPCKLEKTQHDLREHKRYSKKAIEQMKEEGFVLKTGDGLHGDVLFDLGRRRKEDGKHIGPRVKLGYIAARRFGFGGYVIYNSDEDGGFCSIQTTKGMDFRLSEGFRVSGRYHLITKKKGEGPLQTTIEDVMKNLSGEADHHLLSIKAGNALRKILDKQSEISSVRRTGPAVGEMRGDGSIRVNPYQKTGSDSGENMRENTSGYDFSKILEPDEIKAAHDWLYEMMPEKMRYVNMLMGAVKKIIERRKAEKDWLEKNMNDRRSETGKLVLMGYKNKCVQEFGCLKDQAVEEAVLEYILGSIDLN